MYANLYQKNNLCLMTVSVLQTSVTFKFYNKLGCFRFKLNVFAQLVAKQSRLIARQCLTKPIVCMEVKGKEKRLISVLSVLVIS